MRIVVIGGGPAGCAYAVTAASAGHTVTLLDDGRRPATWPGEALPSGGGELLESVFGAGLLEGHAEAFGTAAAWGSAELVPHDFMAHWAGRGWHLDRAALDADMRLRARSAGVDVVTEHMSGLSGTPGAWRVNDHPPADLIVDASGRAGAVVGRLGVKRVRLDDQVALVGVAADLGGESITTIEAVAHGWWYSAPLPHRARVAALVTDSDLVGSHRAEMWHQSLASTQHIAPLIAADPRTHVSAYPAGATHREDIHGVGWVAVGDAAVSVDPLSSQGTITGVVMAAHAARLANTGLVGWEANYRAILSEHEEARAWLYAAETRWPASRFWARRAPDAAPRAGSEQRLRHP